MTYGTTMGTFCATAAFKNSAHTPATASMVMAVAPTVMPTMAPVESEGVTSAREIAGEPLP